MIRTPFNHRGTIIALVVAIASGVGIASLRTNGEGALPLAHSYLFNAKLLLLHGGGDLLIGIGFLMVSGILIVAASRTQEEIGLKRAIVLLATTIALIGITFLVELWATNAAAPPYWLSAWLKIAAGISGIVTLSLLPALIPKVAEVLKAAKESAAREEELSSAYHELGELYRKATQPAPRKETLSLVIEAARREEHGPERLADIARGVTLHALELERAKHAAEAANLAKDQFLAVLSHELRTPLTPALAAASSLESNPEVDQQELRESLSMIRRNIELEARLVDDLLDLTRISRGKLQIQVATIDLHQTIRHAVDMCQADTGAKRAEVVMNLDATESHVRGDAARLAQVFWNLTLNAIKFTPADGLVTISTANPSPGTVRIEVQDTGIGIEADKLTRIFEPFQQAEESTSRRYGGLGLGLSVAQGLVKAHGGVIQARSDGPGNGATFLVELQTSSAAPATVEEKPVVPLADADRRLRVLVVEDHPDTRRVLERILARWGHEVATAGSVSEGVKRAAAFQPQLLISDIGLPDGTGLDLLSQVTSRHDFHAIAMSGYGMESDLELTKAAGFQEHLVKPVSADRLKEAIQRLVAS
jgi:signal transduction histidine kinase